MENISTVGESSEASFAANTSSINTSALTTHYDMECFDSEGNLKWSDGFDNIVVNSGLDDVLDKYFKGSAYTAAHYIGLKLAGSVVAGDTMASHAGWAESTAYSNATRPVLTLGAVSGQSVDNSASKASFSINATATITGSFTTTDNTKGGAVGILYGGGEFTTPRGVADGDTLNVTATYTNAAV